ncbi:anti-sigma factor [Rhodanobacter denitrificans]|uniref:Anti-sigma factor n=1 Tax=Rhodanobacter denitrificans TaxID=666685 RepID=A0A368KHK3_9GAMM|nr:anti-sigma factor [Rhodanobacter denitrificans]RCS30465.1 anti-sigma factor [Rhodanobacter denitrificans]
MNTPIDDGNHNLRYAEYVLGVLDADTRAEVAREVLASDEAATAVALWQRRLIPLAETVGDVAPAPYVWARIHDALQLDAPARAPLAQPRRGLWNNLALWHWLGIGASAVAVALLVVVSLPRPVPAPKVAGIAYMASTIQQDNGTTGWTATMDLQHARMVVVPATPVAFAQGRAPELWLIPAGQKPISVGMIARDKPTTIALDPALLARLGPTAALAVSVEPIGGSPTGQPTGAVIAKGAIGAAPDAGGKVAMIGNVRTDRPWI